MFRYEVEEEDDDLRTGIACVIRAPKDIFNKPDVLVNLEDDELSRFRLGEHEELASNILVITATPHPTEFKVLE